jgi:CRP-like cAMP-binding protein
VLIQEGDIGSSFFIVISGQVKVVKQDKLLNLLKGGECFGEMAYLGSRSSSARRA